MIFMKHSSRLLAVFAAVLLGLASHVQAQVVAGAPTTIDYQGKALDATGSPLANTTPTNYEMRFRIYDAQEGGTVIWSEKQIVTVSKGLFSVRLGEGTVLVPAEGSIAQTALADAFASKERFLGVTIVITGQTPAEILPRLAVGSRTRLNKAQLGFVRPIRSFCAGYCPFFPTTTTSNPAG